MPRPFAAWAHEFEPPKQKPTVKTLRSAEPAARSASTAAAVSALTPSKVVCATWSLKGNSSSRFDSPCERRPRSRAHAAHRRCGPRPTAGSQSPCAQSAVPALAESRAAQSGDDSSSASRRAKQRCQRTTVSGSTITSVPRQPDQPRASSDQSRRSWRRSRGRAPLARPLSAQQMRHGVRCGHRSRGRRSPADTKARRLAASRRGSRRLWPRTLSAPASPRHLGRLCRLLARRSVRAGPAQPSGPQYFFVGLFRASPASQTKQLLERAVEAAEFLFEESKYAQHWPHIAEVILDDRLRILSEPLSIHVDGA